MYTDRLGEQICDGLEDGKSLLQVCRELNLKESTVRKWARDNADFGTNYARAREMGDDAEFERLADLAAENPVTVEGKIDQGWVAWKRNQIDTHKWMLARKRPKKYGERTTIAGDEDYPIAVKRVVSDL